MANLTAQVELLKEGLEELKPLLPGHWEELALNKEQVPLDPRYDIYLARELSGEFLYVTLREEGRLVGYFTGFVEPGLHYKTCLTCISDIFYVVPEARGKGGGQVLFKGVESELRRRGVQRWFVGEKEHQSTHAGPLLLHLGFSKTEVIYSKWLGS